MDSQRETWIPKINRLLASPLTEADFGSARPLGLPHWHLLLITAGELDFGQPPAVRRLEVGDLLLTAPGLPLFYRPARPRRCWSSVYAVFEPWPHWMEWLDWPALENGSGWLRLPGRSELARVRTLFDEVIAQARASEFLGLNALERLLITAGAWNPQRHPPDRDPRIHTARQYLQDNLHRMVAVAEVAHASGLSPSRLAHLFRAETGLTPMQFLDQHRMRRACQLLSRTPLPIKEIAGQVGYPDIYHFSQRFKKLLGLPPTAYRHKR